MVWFFYTQQTSNLWIQGFSCWNTDEYNKIYFFIRLKLKLGLFFGIYFLCMFFFYIFIFDMMLRCFVYRDFLWFGNFLLLFLCSPWFADPMWLWECWPGSSFSLFEVVSAKKLCPRSQPRVLSNPSRNLATSLIGSFMLYLKICQSELKFSLQYKNPLHFLRLHFKINKTDWKSISQCITYTNEWFFFVSSVTF